MPRLTATQFIVIIYLIAVIGSTTLLMLPLSQRPGVRLSPIDALFTATSGISVTGLTVVNTADTFSYFGTFALMFIMQFGGIGIMTLGTFLWMIFGGNIGLSYRRLIMIDQNRYNLSGLVNLIRLVLTMAIVFELLGMLILGTYFLAAGYFDQWDKAYYYGLFQSLSAYTNAGFDIFGDSMFRFSNDYFVQIVTLLLMFLGAIGFPVLIEVYEYFFGKHKNFRFSLFTKVTTSTFLLLILLGAAGIMIIEQDLFFADKSWHEKLFYSLFNSLTTRNCGLATMDPADFSVPTQFLLSILMFIGASPSSVGGGIRTTTFAVIILTIYTYARGKNEVRIFKRSLRQEDILKSFVVFAVAMMLVSSSAILLDAVEKQRFPLMNIIFEVSSAFGTTGLSLGITGNLSTLGKLLVIFLMFVGRIGILSLLFIFKRGEHKEKYHYPEEKIIIG